jgi:hypothetical protein
MRAIAFEAPALIKPPILSMVFDWFVVANKLNLLKSVGFPARAGCE